MAKLKRHDANPYLLGHTHGPAGVDLVTLAAMLGHSKINMVLRYAHPTEEQQFAAMEKMPTLYS